MKYVRRKHHPGGAARLTVPTVMGVAPAAFGERSLNTGQFGTAKHSRSRYLKGTELDRRKRQLEGQTIWQSLLQRREQRRRESTLHKTTKRK